MSEVSDIVLSRNRTAIARVLYFWYQIAAKTAVILAGIHSKKVW